MTAANWQKIFEIVTRNQDAHDRGGRNPISAAEHDVVYLDILEDEIPEESDDGLVLQSLNCHVDSGTDSWAKFV